MAQYTCTELKKRQILAAMFLTIFIGLLGIGVTFLRSGNKACATVPASP